MAGAQRNVLGISPGTRSIGIAILRDGRLIDCRTKTFKGKWSKKKLQVLLSAILQFIEEESISMIAVKINHPARSSKQLDTLVLSIAEYAKSQRIPVKKYSIAGIEKKLCKGMVHNKNSLVASLIQIYPELSVEYSRELKNRNSYYLKLFEAVGAACLANSAVRR